MVWSMEATVEVVPVVAGSMLDDRHLPYIYSCLHIIW